MLSGLIALGARALATPIGQACGEACAASEIPGEATCAAAPCDDDLAADEPARSAADVGAVIAADAFVAVAGAVGADDVLDGALRRVSPWRWGRLDLAVAWRRTSALAAPARARGMTVLPRTRDELWLVATWRY